MEIINNPSKAEIINMIISITQKVDKLLVIDRREILRLIIKSGVEDHKIHSKGNGTQIKFKDMKFETITIIYNFIQNKMAENLVQLESIIDENVEDSDV